MLGFRIFHERSYRFTLLLTFVLAARAFAQPAADQKIEAADWVSRFAFAPPQAATEGVCVPSGLGLPSFAVTPSADGKQLVRVSLPFAPGVFPADLGLEVSDGDEMIVPDVRPLTYHPGRPAFVRRAILTFVYDFPDTQSRQFYLTLGQRQPGPLPAMDNAEGRRWRVGDLDLLVTEDGLTIRRQEQVLWQATFIAPRREWSVTPTTEVIEQGGHYLWLRLLVPDVHWPRVIEVRADSLGTVAVRGHLQRLLKMDGRGRAPELGWRIEKLQVSSVHVGDVETPIDREPIEHSFAEGRAAWLQGPRHRVAFPDAHLKKRGLLTVRPAAGGLEIVYLRCQSSDRVPHQYASFGARLTVCRGRRCWSRLIGSMWRRKRSMRSTGAVSTPICRRGACSIRPAGTMWNP